MKAPCFLGRVSPRRGEERNPIHPAERDFEGLKPEAMEGAADSGRSADRL